MHVALLGDSIFDNGAYTAGGPDVVTQVRALLDAKDEATLLAVDGAKMVDVAGQLRRLTRDATHLVLSVGGNDVLGHLPVLDLAVSSVAEAMTALSRIAAPFEEGYRRTVDACLRLRLPLAVCTIYNGSFADGAFQRVAAATLTIFNDAIIRVAVEHALPVIDLRLVCSSPGDYANPIEPSSTGGAKIARAIVAFASRLSDKPGTRIIV